MKKFIGWLIVSLVTSSAVSAQSLPISQGFQVERKTATGSVTSVWCGSTPVDVSLTMDEWNRKSERDKKIACDAAIAANGKVAAVYPETTRPYNKGLGITGAIILLGGVVMMLPQGDEYHVLGEPYCVGPYSVDAGGCGPSRTLAKIGLLTTGIGATLAYVGWHSVTVASHVGKESKSVTATISWGGERAR